MKKNALGLHMNYHVKMGLGKCGAEPISTVVMQGNYCLPILVLAGVALLCITVTVARWICFHSTYKKR